MAEPRPSMDDQQLVEALAELGRTMPYPPTPDLASAVRARVAQLGPPPQPSWLDRLVSSMQHLGLLAIGVVALVTSLVVFGRAERSSAEPTAQLVVVFRGDLTESERAELAARFGAEHADATVETQSVSRQELHSTLHEAGVPVVAGDAAVSSVAVVCHPSGEGLHIRTEHVTCVAPQDYAHMLLIAGAQHVEAQISAPPNRPVTGETALVGLFRGSARCQPSGSLNRSASGSPTRTWLGHWHSPRARASMARRLR